METKQLKTEIEKLVDEAVENLFTSAHTIAQTTSGDIYPEQMRKVEQVKKQLSSLICKQVLQNLP